ncbi:MAG: hypothetical protein E3K36_10010 [Candidatus Brocadia sp.]|nr:hypothetical protein [Candidatus Brocadia sp.]
MGIPTFWQGDAKGIFIVYRDISAIIVAMTTMITEVYEAFKEAGVSEEKAKAAASAIADFEKHFTHIESDLTDLKAEVKVLKIEINLVKWMLGFVIAGIISIIIKLFI